jgi:hypothetical protein
MDKETIINNGWVTDVAVACDDKVIVDSLLFESCITHADVHELVYGDNPEIDDQILTGIIYDNIKEEDLTENDILYYENKGRKANVVIERKLIGNMYNTLTLPFSLTTLENTPLQDCEIYKPVIKNYSTSSRTFTLGADPVTTLEAGVPYLVIPKSDIYPLYFDNVTLEIITNSECKDITFDDCNVVCKGFINPYYCDPNDPNIYKILMITSHNTVSYAGTAAYTNGMRFVMIDYK